MTGFIIHHAFSGVGGVSRNHHPKSVSTSLGFFAAQKFRVTGPFSITIRKPQALDLAVPNPALRLD